MRGEWIEIRGTGTIRLLFAESLPMRGEWIEIGEEYIKIFGEPVSPHAGRVD